MSREKLYRQKTSNRNTIVECSIISDYAAHAMRSRFRKHHFDGGAILVCCCNLMAISILTAAAKMVGM